MAAAAGGFPGWWVDDALTSLVVASHEDADSLATAAAAYVWAAYVWAAIDWAASDWAARDWAAMDWAAM